MDCSTPEWGYDSQFTGYVVVAAIPDEDRARALRSVREMMEPPKHTEIQQALARLRVSTKSREEADFDLTLMLQVFAELCWKYPADIVEAGLRHLGETERFWPALVDVKAEFDRRVKKRRALLAALEG